jgi:hypothetical protein
VTDHLIELGKAAAALGALAGLGTLGWKVALGLLRVTRKVTRMADEVLGDGDNKPGWGKRIAALEAKLSTVAAEVKPNGGASLKDQVTRIEQATGATRGSDGR